ncbi:hypothetical protein ACHAWX_005625 [Stephanocyclus meneghinianus]
MTVVESRSRKNGRKTGMPTMSKPTRTGAATTPMAVSGTPGRSSNFMAGSLFGTWTIPSSIPLVAPPVVSGPSSRSLRRKVGLSTVLLEMADGEERSAECVAAAAVENEPLRFVDAESFVDFASGSEILGGVVVGQREGQLGLEEGGKRSRHDELVGQRGVGVAIGRTEFERVGVISVFGCRGTRANDVRRMAAAVRVRQRHGRGDVGGSVGKVVRRENRGDQTSVAGGSRHDRFGYLGGGHERIHLRAAVAVAGIWCHGSRFNI